MISIKKSIICSITLLAFAGMQAQTIEGTVYDAKTKETVPGVAIYVDGTSIFTTSDKNGRFLVIRNPDNVDHLLFFGEIGKQRLGDMLPMDYTYVPPLQYKR